MKDLRFFRTLLVGCTALLLVVGCGGDDDDDDNNGGEASVQQGTWTVKSTTTILGTDASCQGIPPEVVTEDDVICDDGDLTGGEDVEGLGCDYNISGNTFELECDLSTPVGPCTLRSVISGSGTFTDTTYDITVDFTTTATGTDPSCVALNNPCTTRTRIQGTWKNSSGSCDEKPGSLKLAVARGIDLAVSRMR